MKREHFIQFMSKRIKLKENINSHVKNLTFVFMYSACIMCLVPFHNCFYKT